MTIEMTTKDKLDRYKVSSTVWNRKEPKIGVKMLNLSVQFEFQTVKSFNLRLQAVLAESKILKHVHWLLQLQELFHFHNTRIIKI